MLSWAICPLLSWVNGSPPGRENALPQKGDAGLKEMGGENRFGGIDGPLALFRGLSNYF